MSLLNKGQTPGPEIELQLDTMHTLLLAASFQKSKPDERI